MFVGRRDGFALCDAVAGRWMLVGDNLTCTVDSIIRRLLWNRCKSFCFFMRLSFTGRNETLKPESDSEKEKNNNKTVVVRFLCSHRRQTRGDGLIHACGYDILTVFVYYLVSSSIRKSYEEQTGNCQNCVK